MPQLTFLPHYQIGPAGKVITVEEGTSILEAALANEIELEHNCGGVCACTTCHIIVQTGLSSLLAASEVEEDLLDRAWGLTAESRLACQAIVGTENLTIEIPKYTVNLASERH